MTDQYYIYDTFTETWLRNIEDAHTRPWTPLFNCATPFTTKAAAGDAKRPYLAQGIVIVHIRVMYDSPR